MRVAFDHQAFCRRPYTGISRYVVQLTQALAAASIDAHIFAPLHINAFLDQAPRTLVHGKRVPRPAPPLRPLLRRVNQALSRRSIRHFAPDLVHETYYQRGSTAPANVPVVLTVHDLIHERFPDEFPAYDQLPPARRRALGRAAGVICISRRTRDDLLAHYAVPAERVSVVHHGVAPPFSLSSAAEAEVAAAVRDTPFLLYVGQRGGYKNFAALLAAYAGSTALRSSVRLLCVGGDALSASEQARLRALGIADRVTRLGGSDAMLGAAYRRAVALVYPSRYEGFGMPLLEAMIHGCPVAASRGGALPEILGGAGVSFDPDDIDEQRQTLEDLVASADVRERLRARGLARAQAFSWQRCARETLAVYRSLVAGARTRSRT
jgi:glycosyltransferase involved in cell wall biosynthesis